MYYIYPNKNGNPEKNPIAKAPTDQMARRECAKLMGFNNYRAGLWAEDKTTHKFFLIEHFGKDTYLYTNNDGVEKKLDARGNIIRKKKKEWRPFGL